jgi:hypothetical protein
VALAVVICASVVCAADAADADIISSIDDDIVSAENDLDVLSSDTMDTEIVSASEDNEIADAEEGEDVLSDDTSTYSELSREIGSGGDRELQHKHYTYDSGSTIEISTPGLINGNGATIDMAGSSIQAFKVSVPGVTIKNLNIINANYDADGSAIYLIVLEL